MLGANGSHRDAGRGELRLTDFAHFADANGKQALVLVRSSGDGRWLEMWRGLPGTAHAVSTTYSLVDLDDDQIDEHIRSAMRELREEGYAATDRRPPVGVATADFYLDACRYGIPAAKTLNALARRRGPALMLNAVGDADWQRLLAQPNTALMPSLIPPDGDARRVWLVLPATGSSFVCAPGGAWLDESELPITTQALLCAGGRDAPEILADTILELEVDHFGMPHPWPRVVPIDVVDFRGVSGATVEYGERLYQLDTAVAELRDAWGGLPGWEPAPALIRKENIDQPQRRRLTLRRLDAVYAGEIGDAWVRLIDG